jgi:hypothetical protein
MNVVSQVVVPLRKPWDIESVPREWTDSAIAEVLEAAPHAPVLDHWGDRSSLRAYELFRPEDIPQFAGVWQPLGPFTYKYLCFEAIAQVDQSAVRDLLERNNPGWKPSSPELDSLIHQSSAETVSQAVGNVLLAVQLAKPGAIQAEGRVLVSPGRFARVDKSISLGFDAVMSRAKRTGWPRIESLRVQDALQWLLGVPGLLEGDPAGPSGRAVSALASLALRPPPTTEDPVGLMWCLVGLEALYGEGTAHLTQQIAQKSRVVLGEPEAFRKAVSHMYGVRSRFIHGDVDFPLPYRYDDPDPKQFSEPMADAVQLALGILIATLQRLIAGRRYQFAFEYRLLPPPSDGTIRDATGQ